jgi:subtilase family serine protease
MATGLAAGLLACGGGGSNRIAESVLGDTRDPSVAPKPGEKVVVPTPPPDPRDLGTMIGLPNGSADQITFYFTLPTNDERMVEAAGAMVTPGSGAYRHYYSNFADVARLYGATGSDIEAAVKSVRAKGLSALADPSRTFVRVWGTKDQWQKVIGKPLDLQQATPDTPFDYYGFPVVPKFDKLTYVGAGATVYNVAIDGGHRQAGASVQNAAAINSRASANPAAAATTPLPWPANNGATMPSCISGTPLANEVYSPSQIASVYQTSALKETPTTRAVRVSVIDLGGGFSDADVQAAAKCFGYDPPAVDVRTGDGITGRIENNSDETELDLQTMAAFVPGGTIQLIEATNGPASLLDAVSRMLGDPVGLTDGASISYAQCAVQESLNNLDLIHAIGRVAILGNMVGSSLFVAAGDWGSTTCGNSVKGTSQAFAASAPWATAVGGTRLALTASNQRASEVVWDDRLYGMNAGTGGGISKVFRRPWYQNAVTTETMRVVPDFSLLADIEPGWPVMLNGQLESIGGTSGSAPFAMAQESLLSAQERLAGRPPVGFINPWLYQLYSQHPDYFYDVVSGTNDLNRVGCCIATKGFDAASGLGVPNFLEIARHLPPPSP